MSMKIIFFGSSQFAVPSLRSLAARGIEILCVVTQPDKKKGRGLLVEGTFVKKAAVDLGLDVYQPLKINAEEARLKLAGYKADLFVVIAYGQILSQEILDLPSIFALNLHASILPKYRGAAPINWAIINGERNTGISAIKMTKEMDAGPVIAQKPFEISEDDDAVMLTDKLASAGAGLLLEVIEGIEQNTYKLNPQDEQGVTFAPRLKKETGLIDWSKSARELHNLVRGCMPWPGAYGYFKGKRIKFIRTSRVDEPVDVSSGQVIDVAKDAITVATGKGKLLIKELQIEGKKPMSCAEFISGYRIKPQDRFSKK